MSLKSCYHSFSNLLKYLQAVMIVINHILLLISAFSKEFFSCLVSFPFLFRTNFRIKILDDS